MNVQQYLRKLHAKVIYADCAGERAYIPSLHYNRLVSLEGFVRNIFKLQREMEPAKIIQKNIQTAAARSKFESNKKDIDYSNPKTLVNLSNELAEFVGKKGYEVKKIELFDAVEQEFRAIMEVRNSLLEKSENDDQRRRLAPSEDIIQKLEHQPDELHVILGDPGFGKTIHLQQLAERYVQQQRETDAPTLPVYVKAKHLAHAITLHATSPRSIGKDEEDKFDPEDDEETQWEFSSYATEKEVRAILATSVTETHFSNTEDFEPSFNKLLATYEGKFVFFIDAFDEVKEAHMPLLVHFLSRMTHKERDFGNQCVFVMTNRNSHSALFGRLWAKMPEQESANERISKYHIDFTPEELRYDMPEKLMSAWEVNGMAIEMRMEERYEAFSKVLTHPLFVGFFALMVKENELMEELDAVGDGLTIKEYTTNHVVFLNNVVDLGIKKAINDRGLKIKPARMREIYEAIAYGYRVADGTEDNIDTMLKKLKKTTILRVTSSEIKAIKNGVGPLYSSDGRRIQWTHKGMWEIGASKFTYNLPSLITPALSQPELFLLSHLEQHASLNRCGTLLEALFDVLDTYPSWSVVYRLWRTFIPNVPLFEKLEQSKNGGLLATPLYDLDPKYLPHAEYIASCLSKGVKKFPKVKHFSNCPEDTMRFFPQTHLSWGSVVGEFISHPNIVEFMVEHGSERDFRRIGRWLDKLPQKAGAHLLAELRETRRITGRDMVFEFNPAHRFWRGYGTIESFNLILSNWQVLFSDTIQKFQEYFLAVSKKAPQILQLCPKKTADEGETAAFVHAVLVLFRSDRNPDIERDFELPDELFTEANLVGVVPGFNRFYY